MWGFGLGARELPVLTVAGRLDTEFTFEVSLEDGIRTVRCVSDLYWTVQVLELS